jgi:hypothetical protein
MQHAGEMGSGAMMYIRSFIKIGSGIQKLMGARGIPHTTLISLFLNTEKCDKFQLDSTGKVTTITAPSAR